VEPAAESIAAPEPPTTDRSRPIRLALAAVGTISLAIGVVGIVLPVLPTTPFLLLAAACYARASTRMYRWLLGQPALGPIITRWRATGSMAPGVKSRAVLIVVVTFAASVLLVDALAIRVILVITGVIVTVFLARIPTTA
jgi:hypothetical protein